MKCKENQEHCNWVSGKGCKSLHTQRTRSTTNSYNSSIKTSLQIKHTLIDKGTYGCVINPPIFEKSQIIKVILPYRNKHPSDISKLYKGGIEQFNEEYELLDKVQKIDPYNQFTTKMKGAMILHGEAVNSPSIKTCLTKENRKEFHKSYYQLILEYGGVRTDKEYKIQYYEFLQKLKVFLKGIKKLQSQGFVHMDIKPANVLISDEKINLIDFGLMTNVESLFTFDNRTALCYLEYPFYPPEFYLAYCYIKYGEMPTEKLETLFNQDFLIRKNLRDRYINGVSEFINVLNTKISKGKTNIDDLFTREIAMKADVFSIASIISALSKNIQYSQTLEYEQQSFVNNLHSKCFEINPLKRISITNLLKMVSDEEENYSSNTDLTIISLSDGSSSSLNISSGGAKKMNRTYCEKIPMRMLRAEMKPEVKRKIRQSRCNV
jgi:serine/threonine protein kinase